MSKKEKEEKRNYCRHCPLGHAFVCNCGHSHDEHVFRGPCTHIIQDNLGKRKCVCEGYSQTQKRKEQEIVKYNNDPIPTARGDDRAIAVSTTIN